MKKNFPLQAPGKDDARVRDKIRHEINKYVRRCRGKPVPEGFMQWEFMCRVGPIAESAETKTLKEVGGAVDDVAQTGATAVYVEIEAVPAQRSSRS
ncbi:hypothetical protein ESB00_12135 [Oleiharenicola lentus]|uniref:Uncharacterized protein n=1 Tax=Oleiharenicola lentus TaxID=2508720 RepID=A0A4V1M6U1_9BACT|nr:DUF6172 family protein [Oleiharenicola lentus]RXK56579.1 hypothetical protein ESB00_12135 [Oleiharenicola lentus]